MDRILELVGQLEPAAGPPPSGAQARQRAALFRSIAPGEVRTPTHRPLWRPAGADWPLALAGLAVAAVAGALLLPGLLYPIRPFSPGPGVAPGTAAALTGVRRALTGAGGDVEVVTSTVAAGGLTATTWVDLVSGACRTDTSVRGVPQLTVFVEAGRAVILDYRSRQWWSRPSEGVRCEPPTPATILRDLAQGDYSLAGRTTIDGKPSLELVSTAPTSGLHPITKLSTLWVDAATYLPIQSVSTGHLAERTTFSWVAATKSTAAILKVAVPPGFHRAPIPPLGPPPLSQG